jgi:hypothetical protein
MPTYTLTASQLYGQGILNSFSIPASSSFDSDYQAILNKAVSLGYTLPSSNAQTLQNTLLTSLKTDGVWDKLDIFYVFAVDNNASEFATINWKNPNALVNLPTQSTLINAPIFTNNTGFTGNGTDSYIDTNFNPATQGVQYTQNNASRYFFPHAITSTGPVRIDGNTGSGLNTMIRGVFTGQRINAGSTNNLTTSYNYTTLVNVKSIHRTSSTNVTLFNETTGTNDTQTSTAVSSLNQFILRSATFYGSHTCAAYAMGASLVTENTNFVNDWNTYKNSL